MGSPDALKKKDQLYICVQNHAHFFFLLFTLLNKARNWFMLKTGQEKQSAVLTRGRADVLWWDLLTFHEPSHLIFHQSRGCTGIFTVQKRSLRGKSQLPTVILLMLNLNPGLLVYPSNIYLYEYSLHFVISKVIMLCSTIGVQERVVNFNISTSIYISIYLLKYKLVII